MYDPPLTFPLSATFGATEIGRVTLTRVDDDEVPVVKLEATPSTVAEGESITLAATLTLPFGFAAEVGAVELAVTDPYGALSGPPPAALPLSSGNAKGTWTVTAADDVVANESARSITIEVLDNDMASPVAPDAPRSLTAWPSNQQVTLSWLAPLSDGGSATLRYQYQRKAGSGSFGAWSDIPNSAPGQANVGSYTVMGLTNNVAYTFKVRAQNVVGNSAASNQAAGTPRPLTTPGAPREPRVSSGDGKLIVQWAAPTWDAARRSCALQNHGIITVHRHIERHAGDALRRPHRGGVPGCPAFRPHARPVHPRSELEWHQRQVPWHTKLSSSTGSSTSS